MYNEFVLLKCKIWCMKNYTTTTEQQFSVAGIFKVLGNALKNLFESGSNKDFKRLKDFISSWLQKS